MTDHRWEISEQIKEKFQTSPTRYNNMLLSQVVFNKNNGGDVPLVVRASLGCWAHLPSSYCATSVRAQGAYVECREDGSELCHCSQKELPHSQSWKVHSYPTIIEKL